MRVKERALRGSRSMIFIVLSLLLSPAVLLGETDSASTTDREIAHLLDFVGGSECRFVRNGTVHEPIEGRAHLERKRQVLDRRGWISSTEDFIERAATQSSITGRTYTVRCPDAEPVPSGAWLRAELLRLRATGADAP